MTLDKHRLDGLGKITLKPLAAQTFEQLLLNAGYSKIGTPRLRETESKLGEHVRPIVGLR